MANIAFFLVWLFFYCLVGDTIGTALGHPTAGAVIGAVVGIYPAAVLSFATHYNEVLSLGVFPFIVVFMLAPKTARLWISIVLGALPLLWTVGMTVYAIILPEPKNRQKKTKKAAGPEKS